jgi:hypothetical protein
MGSSGTAAGASGRGGTAAWGVLGALLLALLGGAAAADRASWPGFVGDETTYLAQAESLAFDGDLTWSRADHARFFAHWGRPPDGVVLQSTDGGRVITFSKPPFYALYLAPFVRVSPQRGPFVANALLLAFAAVVAARALGRTLGPAAPWWVAVWLFASVAFASVFWAHPDLFLMSLVAIALAIAFGDGVGVAPAAIEPAGGGASKLPLDGADGDGDGAGEGGPQSRRAGDPGRRDRADGLPGNRQPGARSLAGWALAGALVAIVTASRPPYAVLLLPFAVAAFRPRAGRQLAALLAGAALVGGLALVAQKASTGAWTTYGTERRGFYAHTGYPDVDFPRVDWGANLERFGMSMWTGSGEVSTGLDVLPALWRWNALYALAGRHVGLLPYFLPLLLGFAGRPRGAARWALVVAVAAAVAGLLLVRPFNFWGGGAALANRYFLPLYPAFWFLPTRRASPLWPALAALLAAPFLLPLWSAPGAYLRSPDGGYRFVGPAARALLPYETTQNQLKPSGHEDFLHNGLWVKSLSPAVAPAEEGRLLTLAPGDGGAVLVGSAAPLAGVEVLLRGAGGARVWVGEREVPAATGGRRRLAVAFGEPLARHPMWWAPERWWLYEVELRAEGATAPIALALRPLPLE